ncbi:uncharacterized protein MEPE_06662 [Melanopsichium pennsylvanicum]|uniref:Uncharacterized protein n=2 Tax=Melanopsichium pennsylvanicum TaxID=63383 RepID=A0AAJ4XTT4_9BASI|nr:hypothetical protein BN887_02858 [Melanopsichium pennsylvanicum 4]SNX87951.1 uncharacterized protein MEPE_06662 [Melanopsichium pennsylvanicum]
MRHKGFLTTAVDACGHRACQPRQTPRAQVAQKSIAGPSRLPLSGSSSICSPSPSPPPLSPWPSTSPFAISHSLSPSTTAASYSASRQTPTPTTSPSSALQRNAHKYCSPSHHFSAQISTHSYLSFLYPPSCLAYAQRSISPSSSRAVRRKSSLAPTNAVSSAAAAQQVASPHDDRSHQQHPSAHFESDFSFFRHHYDPPPRLVDHPRTNALLQQDASTHLEDDAASHQSAHDVAATPTAPSHRIQASAAALSSLRQQSLALRESLQANTPIDAATTEAACRRVVLQSCTIKPRLHARRARAIAYETVADCATHLLASGQSIPAGNVIRHLLVKLDWHPRSLSELELPPCHASSTLDATTRGKSAAAARLAFVAQQVISLLTLAPSTSSPRPTRRFESQQHLDTATSLLAAMHLAQMPRSTASQTALIRAMITSGHTQLAVQTFTAEVRAWWSAHKEARRPRSSMRRKAAFTVESGKPSSQALREITSALQQVEQILSRVRPDLLTQLSERERQALTVKRTEYASSLVDLIRLVRGGRLPIPPAPSAPEMIWIQSACCRFESTTLLNESTGNGASSPGPLSVAEKKSLRGAAEVIRYYLREYMQSLPDGQTRSAGNLLIAGEPVIRPALGIVAYNQLIHYAMSVLKSPSICKEVFQHMTQLRRPPLEPDAVTFNTILRQATTQRSEALARAVLITNRQSQFDASGQSSSQGGSVAEQSSKRRAPTPAATMTATPASDALAIELEQRPIRPMLQQIDTAIAQADSYRLVSLLQYVTASGLFLRRYRHEPGHAGVKEVVMRIYPALNTQRYARKSTTDALGFQQSSDLRLRPKANQASRHAILSPHVLTAALNLVAKAGKTGLALRVWRLLKRTSLQSALRSPSSDVAETPWKIPVEAATIIMQVLANEAARAPTTSHSLRSRPVIDRRMSQLTAHRQYARGWNIVASLRGRSYAGRMRSIGRVHNSAGQLGEGLRWRAAQLLAKREYAFLVHHWQLSRRLGRWRRQRLEGILQSRMESREKVEMSKRVVLDFEADQGIQPDSRFYDALLNVFGRRPGMVQRSRRHTSRSEVLSQLRRGYGQASRGAATPTERQQQAVVTEAIDVSKPRRMAASLSVVDNAAAPSQEINGLQASNVATDTHKSTPEQQSEASTPNSIDPHSLSTSQQLTHVVNRITFNSRGRRTSLPPDPCLLRILFDMEAFSLDIPVAFRWILAYCSGTPEVLENEEAARGKKRMGAFSAWRGPRVKTRGLIARRPNIAATKLMTEKKSRS